jgi:hypothetical protein
MRSYASTYQRHCEEPLRRSNPTFLRPWIASLALAMTDLEARTDLGARFEFESDRRHPEEVPR